VALVTLARGLSRLKLVLLLAVAVGDAGVCVR
jgi:hypothetical protein